MTAIKLTNLVKIVRLNSNCLKVNSVKVFIRKRGRKLTFRIIEVWRGENDFS
jgi:hypothetical protein